ncbi:uncharacterized protein LOC113271960 [Papaver somniferum]|uniref:uncharacterized protein LOC113271960 n=1 Tax=Papaver somniferum TaxID=3469 RepID=UPI000E703E65|nr:uncharacterized protein LOC113271960 [Papaver somniferum]
MCGRKDLFDKLDESVRSIVKFGNSSTIPVMGKGRIEMVLKNGSKAYIMDVFYVPGLYPNLLSMGQPSEKGYSMNIYNGLCFIRDRRRSLQILAKKEIVSGLPFIELPKQKCENCIFGKQHRDPFSVNKTRRAEQQLEIIHSDLCGPIEVTSHGVDSFLEEHGIQHQLTTRYTPQQNGVAEKKNRTIMEMERTIRRTKDLPKNFWGYAVDTTVYLINICPTNSLNNMTPEEAWRGTTPSVRHLKVFGCVAYAHVPKELRKKLDHKSEKCILVGYISVTKGYKLFNPETEKVITSRNVIFNEDSQWNWNTGSKNNVDPNSGSTRNVDTHTGSTRNVDPPSAVKAVPIVVEEEVQTQDNVEVHHEEARTEATPQQETTRPRRKYVIHVRLNDYVISRDDEDIDEDVVNSALFGDCDHVNYKEASKEQGWIQAMNEELKSIEKNDTWELNKLPPEKKPIGVKWVHKTKYKSNGEVHRLKARLVAKGYRQRQGVDYSEVFAPVARIDTIKMKIALAAQKRWKIFQMDVNYEMINEFREDMMKEFEMTHLGIMSYFLGIEVQQTERGIFINQLRYAKGILKRFKMDNCNPILTPVDERLKLTREGSGELVNSTDFKGLVGCLRYLTATRPDIIGTTSLGIFYNVSEDPKLVGFTDSDTEGRKSTSGYGFQLGTGFFSWSSKKQQVVALSTTETEYIAASNCATQAVWLRMMLKSLFQEQKTPTKIVCDNKSTISLTKNHVLHGRSKHIDIKFHYIIELFSNKEIVVEFYESEEQVENIFTKSLKSNTFIYLRGKLGMIGKEYLGLRKYVEG